MKRNIFFVILLFLPFVKQEDDVNIDISPFIKLTSSILNSDIANQPLKTTMLKTGWGIGAFWAGLTGNQDNAVDFMKHFERPEFKVEQEKGRKKLEELKRNHSEHEQQASKLQSDISNLQVKFDQLSKSVKSTSVKSNEIIEKFSTSIKNFKDENEYHFKDLNNTLDDINESLEWQFLENIEKIDNTAQKLDASINRQFRALSELNVHMKFTEAILLDTDALETLMIQAMNFPKNETRTRFIELYVRNSPRKIIMELASRFKYKFTNPIIASMEMHFFKSRRIFNSWKDTIGQILFRLVSIEGFYHGLIGSANNVNQSAPCFAAVQQVMETFNQFRSGFKLEISRFWPNIIGFKIDQIMRRTVNKDEAADEIYNLLNGIYTTDVFTIHVADGKFEKKDIFKHTVRNPGRLESINSETFYAVSPYNTLETNSATSMNIPKITQITSYNDAWELAVSVVRSETHYKRDEYERQTLNENFEKDGAKYIKSGDYKGFAEWFNELVGRDDDRIIGGAVVSRAPVAERITNSERSALNWYNQVPSRGIFFDLMWI